MNAEKGYETTKKQNTQLERRQKESNINEV